jgi:hypothetical protein
MLASMRRRRISTSFRWFARKVGLSSDGKGQDGILGGIAADRGRQRWRVDDSARNRTSANIRSGSVLDRLSTAELHIGDDAGQFGDQGRELIMVSALARTCSMTVCGARAVPTAAHWYQ